MAETSRTPLVVRMADVEPEDVGWLWYPYLPRGKLTILEGDPGAGKTWLALAIAAAITRGRVPAGRADAPTTEPASVLYLTGEDGLADTLRPRLDAAGADVSRMHVLIGWQQEEMQGAITLSDLAPLEAAITQVKPALVVIDPIQAYLGARVDMHRANETRPILTALAALGEQYGCTPLCIRHLSKAAQDRTIYRGLGSIDFAAAARSILLAGQDPRDQCRRMLAHAKSSLAALGPSLAYELREGQFLWAAESPLIAEDLLRPQPTDEERSAVDEAQDWLREILADGPQPTNEIMKAAKKAGIAEITLRRAKLGLVKARKDQSYGQRRGEAPWVWQLIDKDDQATQEPYTHDMIIFKERQTGQSNQQVTRDDKDDHMIIFNRNGNGQRNQQVTSDDKDDHRESVGGDDRDDHLERAKCLGCREPFAPLHDGTSKTLCRACQGEVRRGMKHA